MWAQQLQLAGARAEDPVAAAHGLVGLWHMGS